MLDIMAILLAYVQLYKCMYIHTYTIKTCNQDQDPAAAATILPMSGTKSMTVLLSRAKLRIVSISSEQSRKEKFPDHPS